MMLLRLLPLALIIGCASESPAPTPPTARSPEALSFDAFPLVGDSETPRGTPLAREPLSEMPDRAREAMVPTAEANYAGTYAVVSWGCGTLCVLYAVLDTETTELVGTFQTPLDVVYRTDSRLLLVNPPSVPVPEPTPGLSDSVRTHTQAFVLREGVLYDLGARPR